MSPAAGSLEIGATIQVSATPQHRNTATPQHRNTATPKDGKDNPPAGRAVTWTLGSTTVASLSPIGVATGVAPGPVTIGVASEGKSETAQVTVTLPPVATVTVMPRSARDSVGGTKLTLPDWRKAPPCPDRHCRRCASTA